MRSDEKGFTLAELLIVVAIVLVLVAVAIPVFTSQIERSREATDQANIRSAVAELKANVLSGSYDQKIAAEPTSYQVRLEQGQSGWQVTGQTDETDDPFADVAQIVGMPQPQGTAILTYDATREKGTVLTYGGESSSDSSFEIADPQNSLFQALLANPLSDLSCYDSEHPTHKTIQGMNETLAADGTFSKDIASWTIVNPKAQGNFGSADSIRSQADQLYYIWTTVPIKDKRGQQVPVVMSHTESGKTTWTVGRVKVTRGDDERYNVIERDAVGRHPRHKDYDINTVIVNDESKKEFQDYSQAASYYQKLAAKMS